MLQIIMYLMYQYIHRHCFPSMRKTDMGILACLQHHSSNIMKSEAYDTEGNNMWFKQGRIPMNLQAKSQGELMDGTNIKVTTLMDTGCSNPILNRKFYNKHPYLHKLSNTVNWSHSC